jgi:hypothetical protein
VRVPRVRLCLEHGGTRCHLLTVPGSLNKLTCIYVLHDMAQTGFARVRGRLLLVPLGPFPVVGPLRHSRGLGAQHAHRVFLCMLSVCVTN